MLKNYLLLIVLLVAASAKSQNYIFDYMLEYSHTDRTDTITKIAKTYTDYRFINSKDNSYCLTVHEAKGTTYLELLLESGKYFRSNLSTEDFFVEGISIKCPYAMTLPSDNIRMKDYDFITKADTVINTQPFKYFVLQPANKKKIERLEISTQHYIIDNSLYLQLPMLKPQSLAYRFWKYNGKTPSGVIKESYNINALGNTILEMHLVQLLPIKKIVIIDLDCK
ncbi:hypothetical protein [Flavobacterium subsaxonicum]|uniref:Uncharacterized protein n=1 Tax=Flavobacterium subsaxonicum WB 4.1-42 = DSM 21790 TaxID=1121898 RepID=A0A0A2MQY6_9FLAO|nr:hypothetical protein [Flavobacterium subsaxonicum]KGO94724.1 hypothetical protein Q766_01010 [Flavobacterium subsaxonicum WB 4.1-42 = DSM 21790]